MEFLLTEEQKIFRDTISTFVKKEILPVVEDYEGEERFPVHLIKKMGDYGFLGIRFSEETLMPLRDALKHENSIFGVKES